MNWFSKNYMRLQFQKRVDALKKAGIPVTQQTVYDERIEVGVPVPSASRGSGRSQSDDEVNSFAFAIDLVTSSIAAFCRFLVTPRGPTVFEEANRQYFRSGGVGQRLTTSLLLLVIGVAGAVWSGSVAYRGISSSSWPTTTGVMGSSEITTHAGNRSTSGQKPTVYAAKVTYMYAVGNREYVADRLCFGNYGSSDGSRARQIQARYPAGATVLVYYQPSNPEVAVLETGSTWFMNLWFAFFSLITFCGIVGVVRAINAKRIHQKADPASGLWGRISTYNT